MSIKVIIRKNDFSDEIKEEMWAVYRAYYTYTKESFMSRFAKNNYYSMYMDGEKIIGFTGLRINEFEVEGKDYFTIYFGQTVIEKSYRGSSLIQKTGIKLCIKFFYKLISCKSFFWADTLTFRSYLVFAKTLEEYYPTFKSKMPRGVKKLRNFLGRKYYKETFCEKNGTIIKNNNVVTDTSAKVKNIDLRDPDIAFFAHKNSNHSLGHGLLTMGPINMINLFKIVTKIVKRAFNISDVSSNVRSMYASSRKAA